MNTIKIAFFDSKPYDIESFNKFNQNYNYEIKFFKPHLNIDTVALAQGYDVVCIFVNDIIDKEIIEKLKVYQVKLIALRCAGYNNIDLKAAYKNMHVVRVPAYSPYAVAEHAMALILSLNRKIHKAYNRTRDNNFTIAGLQGFDLYNKIAGVIGAGKIGRVMINILKGFGIQVLVYDAFEDQDYAQKSGIKYVSLDEIYEKAHIISLHCPLTKETYHLIDAKSINKMKQGIMLINTSRGQLIDTTALIEGLKSKKIGFAGLDVYEEEAEYFFEDFSNSNIDDDILARLITFNNVLITSHQAFFTNEALKGIADTTFENIKAYFTGKLIENEICYKCDASVCNKKEKGFCFK